MTTPEAVRQALCRVTDPLLGQNLVELGMVQDVRVARSGRVTVRVTLPSPHWPVTDELIPTIRAAVASLPGVSAADVQPVADPPWTPYRLSLALKAPLGLPAEEPSSPSPPVPPASSPVQRLLQRLRSR